MKVAFKKAISTQLAACPGYTLHKYGLERLKERLHGSNRAEKARMRTKSFNEDKKLE